MRFSLNKIQKKKFICLGILTVLAIIGYLFIGVKFSNPKLFMYSMKIRIPKVIVMIIVSFSIGGAIFVLVCDMIGRVIIFPYELPIELIIGILGSIPFIFLLFYRLQHGRKAIRLKKGGTK